MLLVQQRITSTNRTSLIDRTCFSKPTCSVILDSCVSSAYTSVICEQLPGPQENRDVQYSISGDGRTLHI